MSFDLAFDRLIGNEGGFQDNPKDRGNWTSGRVGVGQLKGTKYGISAMTYPHLNIKRITLAQAKVIYFRDWWEKIGADELDFSITYQLWDFAINSGMETAVRALQRAIDVAEDGYIGEVTLDKIQEFSVYEVLFKFHAIRLRYYTRLTRWDEFGKSWANRVANNLDYSAKDTNYS